MNDLLLQRISDHISVHSMVSAGDLVLAAVSGGKDSCAMLHALHLLSEKLGIRLAVAHLNHSFRGDESDADAEFVEGFSGQLSVPCFVRKVDVPGAARRLHKSSQEAAREIRRQFLLDTANGIGAAKIALGHTQDDHIETILLNVIRGAGTDGLRGLLPVAGRFIRPILQLTTQETAEYCASNRIAFREDSSNRSLRYKRNRVRQELLPELATYYNPDIRGALLRLSEIAGPESGVLDGIANRELEEWTISQDSERLVLDANGLRSLDVAILRRVIRQAIRSARGHIQDVEFETVDRCARSIIAGIRFGEALKPGRLRLLVADDRFEISSIANPSQPLRVSIPVAVPGITTAPELRLQVSTELAKVGPLVSVSTNRLMLVADAGKVKLPIQLRNRRPGDRIQPPGMTGRRKVQDILVDRKVPASLRDDVPLIEDAEGLIWVAGHTVAERICVTEATRCALIVRLEPMGYVEPAEDSRDVPHSVL